MTLTQCNLEQLEARLAEELEERTEFCDWLSVCTSVCGGSTSTTTCTTPVSGAATCTTTTTPKCGR